jgi:hypothetical protein
MIGFFIPCFLIFAALFGGRVNALVVDYPDFLKSDLPGYARLLCSSVESYLKQSSIGQDPVLSRLGHEISRIGICEPGHRLFFLQRVSDQDMQRLLLIRDQVQLRVSEIQQINLLLTLVLVSVFALLALVILSRAGKRIAQAVCLMYCDLMLVMGFVWKLDYEYFMSISNASWGLAQELMYRSKDVILFVLDWICVHMQSLVGGESSHYGELFCLDWLMFYIVCLFSLYCFCRALIAVLCRWKYFSSKVPRHQPSAGNYGHSRADENDNEFMIWRNYRVIRNLGRGILGQYILFKT